jgi:cytochrome P450
VHHDEELGAVLLCRYRDCNDVLSNPQMGVPHENWHDRILPRWREHPAARWCFTSMPSLDLPDHARIRSLVNRAFTPRRVEALLPRIRGLVGRLLDELHERGDGGAVVDLQAVVGFRLPVEVIGALVGVPDSDLPRFRWVFGDILRLMDLVHLDEAILARADAGFLDVREYFTDLLAERRIRPRDDLASALITVRDDGGDRLSEDELLDLVILLFTAGFETTTLTIGTGTRALLEHPGQRDLVRADPTLAAGAAEEILRWDCVLQRVTRMVKQDVVVGGVRLAEGTVVVSLLGSANRDPEAYRDPDRFDVRRSGPRLLTFGGGPYHCLGYALARMELTAYLVELCRRFPRIELAAEPARRRGFYLRGLDTLPVALGDRTSVART